ncbi:MAG: hypothetical protein J6B17_00875 [Ruminococcus sp.]|nr:hypothetical protein [Ruminococcus sp.]
MLGCKVSIESYTHARKAQKLLEGYGYSCDIKRISGNENEGCSYMLITKGDCTSVSDILVSGGILYKQLQNIRR